MAIEPVVINAVWNDGQVRVIDFQKFLAEYAGNGSSLFGNVLQADVLMQAKTHGRTVYWDNIAQMEITMVV